MFISILERDDLKLKEIDIWDHVIKWGIGQNQELAKDITEWKKEDFVKLKNTIKDFIPLIRFNQITSNYTCSPNYFDTVIKGVTHVIKGCYTYVLIIKCRN